MAKIFVWIYALTGSVYFAMFVNEDADGVIHRHAIAPLYALMMAAPVVLIVLVAVVFVTALFARR